MADRGLDDTVRSVLHTVYDPCSVAADAPISVVDLGLIHRWERVSTDTLRVHMGVTTAGCTMVGNIMRAIEDSLLRACPELARVEVELHPEVFWTPESMTARGKDRLAARRRVTLAAVRPRQWRDQKAAAGQRAVGG
jgi:metal-sulfur cluster biosynthetic enzyme